MINDNNLNSWFIIALIWGHLGVVLHWSDWTEVIPIHVYQSISWVDWHWLIGPNQGNTLKHFPNSGLTTPRATSWQIRKTCNMTRIVSTSLGPSHVMHLRGQFRPTTGESDSERYTTYNLQYINSNLYQPWLYHWSIDHLSLITHQLINYNLWLVTITCQSCQYICHTSYVIICHLIIWLWYMFFVWLNNICINASQSTFLIRTNYFQTHCITVWCLTVCCSITYWNIYYNMLHLSQLQLFAGWSNTLR